MGRLFKKDAGSSRLMSKASGTRFLEGRRMAAKVGWSLGAEFGSQELA